MNSQEITVQTAALSEPEKILLVNLAAHPGWMSLPFLSFATGFSNSELGPWLDKLRAKGWLTQTESEPYYWKLHSDPIALALKQELGASRLCEIHRRHLEFVAGRENSAALGEAMAFHAGEIAIHSTTMNRFAEAIQAWADSIDFAKKAGRSDWNREFSLNLANLYSHIGRFHQSEMLYREVLSGLDPGEKIYLSTLQNLGAALLEQAKYPEALSIFTDSFKKKINQEAPLELAIAGMHLARIYNSLGMGQESSKQLDEVKALVRGHQLTILEPYVYFLEGRFELISGRFASAFRIFEDAAKGFEELGDLAGKVDVLLTISAALLEYSLIKEAESLIGQIAGWDELNKYPALEHAVHLRRLAIGAFSGRWVQEDLDLLMQDASEVGRTEDWFQFWFHLSLAAKRIGQWDLSDTFLLRAKALAQVIYSRLNDQQQEKFIQRPDIARVWRLTSKGEPGQTQQIRARRSLPSMESADAATLAPPTKEKD